MAQVKLRLADKGLHLECRALRGREALGEALSMEIETITPEPVEARRVLGKACAVIVSTTFGERVLHGVVTRFVAVATAQSAASRCYELTVRSRAGVLALRRRTRVFQHLSVPAIVQKVLGDAGFVAEEIVFALAEDHAEREYVVQYAEDDLSFIRRLCEDEGLYFRFEPKDGFDAFVLEDTSSRAPAAPGGVLPLVEGTDLAADRATAWDCRELRRRRAGKITLRDHDPEHPAVVLEGVAEGGRDGEKGIEVYQAPGRFRSSEGGAKRARVALESIRAEARSIRFQTTAVALAPGLSLVLEASPDYEGAARPEGEHVVVALDHRWHAEAARYQLVATAIPLAVPYRLTRVTPRPRIAGLHPAVVTGPRGQEVHTDAAGRVKVRFPWDREGPTDHASSLPVRVAQPNLPGSLLIPRVGWEVIVAFEDGDPDRPFIVGRAYNAKHPPPFALPANKTVTSLATPSSPGGKCQNSVHFDDAAGRQHMAWAAGSGKTTIVANNMVTQTVGNEVCTVGTQSFVIGGSEKVSVKLMYGTSAASQSLSVGGSQTIRVTGDMGITTGSEAVAVGGLLFERVGNPIKGIIALAEAAALHGAGAKLGDMLKATTRIPDALKGVVGLAIGPALAAVQGGVHGAIDGGASGAVEHGGLAAAQAALGHIPGMDAVTSAVLGTGFAPWHTPPETDGKGAAAPGGGTGGPSAGAAGPAGPGPGHRVTNVGASMTEIIGGPHGVMTPGMIRWTTLGRSMFLIGGNHNIQAGNVSTRTMGASVDTAASLRVNAMAADIVRHVKTGMHRTVDGSLTVSAGKDYRLKAGAALNLKIGGSLSLTGGMVVFHCGRSTVSVSSGGVLFKASSITINGKAQQSGKATTP
jgi:type VI secretion system secreted protein VgrG